MNGKELTKINDNLKSARSQWDSQWQEIADNIVFRKTSIVGVAEPGVKKTQKMYDSTATMSAQELAAWINGNLTSGEWFSLKMGGLLKEVQEYQEWLEEARKIQHEAFRDSNWAGQWNEVLLDLVQFCTGAFYLEENELTKPGFNGFNFISMPPGTYCVMLGRDGRAKGIFRDLRLKPHEAMERWPDKVSDEIKRDAEKDPGKLHDFVQACFPYDWFGKKHRINKPFVSYYIDAKKKTLMQEGGYYWFPFFVIPYLRESGEDYGRGPGWTALPEVKTAHKAQELYLKEWALSILPPMGIVDQGVIGSVRLTPGGLTVMKQQDSLKPLLTGAKYAETRQKREDQRQVIREIFHGDKVKFIPPRDQTGQMTAYEVARRYQLAQMLLGPTFGNIIDHGFDPLIEASFNMLLANGAFPEPPGGLAELLKETNGKVSVEYESPLARVQRVQEIESIQNTLEAVGAMVEVKPDIMDNFKLDDTAVYVAKAQGYPSKLINSDDEREEIREGRAAAQAKAEETEKMALMAKAAKDGAGAAKDMPPEIMAAMAGGGAV